MKFLALTIIIGCLIGWLVARQTYMGVLFTLLLTLLLLLQFVDESLLVSSFLFITLLLNLREAALAHESIGANMIWIIAAIYVGACLFRYQDHLVQRSRKLPRAEWLFVLYIMWGFMVSLLVGDTSKAFGRLFALCIMYLLFFRCFPFPVEKLLRKGKAGNLFLMLSVGCSAFAFVSIIYTVIGSADARIPAQVPWIEPFDRVRGVFGTPNALGLNALVGFSWSVVALLLVRKIYWKILGVVGIIVSLMALFLSNSRASIVSALLFATVIAYAYVRSEKVMMRITLFIIAGLSLYWYYKPYLPILVTYITRGQTDVLIDRRLIYLFAWNRAIENPFGYGWAHVPMLPGPLDSAYMAVLLETGFFGLTLYGGFLLINLLKSIWLATRFPKHGPVSKLLWSCAALMAAAIVHGLFESSINSPTLTLTQSFFLACVLAESQNRMGGSD